VRTKILNSEKLIRFFVSEDLCIYCIIVNNLPRRFDSPVLEVTTETAIRAPEPTTLVNHFAKASQSYDVTVL
jgi:hypothetical protein